MEMSWCRSLVQQFIRQTCFGVGWSVAGEGGLEFLSSEVKIPAAPVFPSDELNTEEVLVLVGSGLDLHLRLLQESSHMMKNPDMLKMMMHDIQELFEQIVQMQSAPQISHTALDPRMFSMESRKSFEKQLFVQRSLQQLQSFTQDVIRSLRKLTLKQT
ncbi:hypothetical protein DNTS_005532 [Danionella cerebrum]|uniref:Interleukin-11 n=1 Tax=Danionella cerebrum TaxID=2873325 RepID=A0A553NJT2_9TELE|nr:hypothetical protein DNTS_005532 [Danionella translucida]